MTPDRLNEIEVSAAEADAFVSVMLKLRDLLHEKERNLVDMLIVSVAQTRELLLEVRRLRATLLALERNPRRYMPPPDPALVSKLQDALAEFPLSDRFEKSKAYRERVDAWWKARGFPAFMAAKEESGGC